VEGYIVSDIEKFPSVPFWKIGKATVLDWWRKGRLGGSTKVSRDVALGLVRSM
jgi:hypothetical protein